MFRTLLVHHEGTRLYTATLNVVAGDGPVRPKTCKSLVFFKNIIVNMCICWLHYHHHHHHHHHHPWIRSFDLFRHRRIVIVSWGVHGLFFLEVYS